MLPVLLAWRLAFPLAFGQGAGGRTTEAGASKPAPRPTRAAERALHDPCGVLEARMGPAPGRKPSPVPWQVRFDPGCDPATRNGLQPSRLPPREATVYLGKRELIGSKTRCANGHRGAPGEAKYERQYYVIQLGERGDALRFEVTEGYTYYDKKEKKFVDVIAGCASYSGELH